MVVAPGFGQQEVMVAQVLVVEVLALVVQLARRDSPERRVLLSPLAVLLAEAVQGLVPSGLLPSGQVLMT